MTLRPSLPPGFSTGASTRGSHRIGSFECCPQLFAYETLVKLKPIKEPEGRARGTLLHEMWMWELTQPSGFDAVDYVRQTVARRVAFAFDSARAMFEAMRADPRVLRWVQRPLAVEQEFQAMLHGHLHTQRYDAVVYADRSLAGARPGAWVLDWKTTGQSAQRMRWEWQDSLQFISAQILGATTLHLAAPAGVGALYAGTMVLAVESTPPHEVSLVTIPLRPPELLACVARGIADTNEAIEAETARGRDPWEWPRRYSQCRGRWGRCDFFPLCHEGRHAVSGKFTVADDVAAAIEH